MSTTFNKSDLLFLLSWRGKKVSETLTIDDLIQLVGDVYEDEYEILKDFNKVMSNDDFVEYVEEKGWFKKTYYTAKAYIESYIKTHYKVLPPYTTTSGNKSDRELIVKILYFYSLKKIDIFLNTIELTAEQHTTVKLNKGIIIVNSGAGTGKTTSAVHKTRFLADDGVIIVSYTNIAVDHFKNKLLEIVDNVKSISDKPGGKIYVCTIDMLARNFLPTSTKKKLAMDNDFDDLINSARCNLNENQSFFYSISGNRNYKHIIIDESQDLTAIRHDFIMDMYRMFHFESITMFGDPRQRLDIKAGAKFENMIRSYKDDDEITLIEYKESFRFQNTILLDLCNTLSEKRIDKGIHVELNISSSISNVKTSKIKVIPHSDGIVEKIELLLKEGERRNEIFIITPSLHKNNKISQKIKRIKMGLAQLSITTSDKIVNDSIFVSSIHGVKGLEANHVFFIGCENYPSTYTNVYNDPNDGDGMNFVANTRAKQHIYYVSNEKYEIPNDVPIELTINGTVSKIIEFVDPVKYSIRSEDISLPDLEKFKKSNIFELFFSVEKKLEAKFSAHAENFLYEIISSILSYNINDDEKIGKNMFQYIEKCQVFSNEREYYEFFNTGKIYDCLNFTLKNPYDKINIIKSDNIDDIIVLSENYNTTSIENHKKYANMMSRKTSLLENMNSINNIVMIIVSVIKKNYTESKHSYYKHTVIDTPIKASCIENDHVSFIFTDNLFLASYHKSTNKKKVYCISFGRNEILQITKADYTSFRYMYMIKALYKISVQKTLIQKRGSTSISSCNIEKPLYFIDTEFAPVKLNKKNTIYDIAIINLFDMFSSTVSMIDCGSYNFRPMPDCPFEYNDFEGSPKITDVVNHFLYLNEGKRVTIHYYHAVHDISPFYEMFDETYIKDKDYGIDFVDMFTREGSLTELYNVTMRSTVESMVHIVNHYAVDDALLLMTIYREKNFKR